MTELEQIYGSIAANNEINVLDLSHNQLDDSASALIAKIVGSHGRLRDEIMWVHSIRGEKPEEDPELKGFLLK